MDPISKVLVSGKSLQASVMSHSSLLDLFISDESSSCNSITPLGLLVEAKIQALHSQQFIFFATYTAWAYKLGIYITPGWKLFLCKLSLYAMERCTLKNVNNCLNTNIYSYLDTSGGKSSNLYLNVVHFFNIS